MIVAAELFRHYLSMNLCHVDVWTINLDAPRQPMLSPEELERAARFRFERNRIHWTNTRSALRAILAGYLVTTPEALQFTYGPNGKPAIEGLEFNISHSGAWAMIGVTREAPIGIDIETIRPNVDIAKLLGRLGETDLYGTTAELFQRWTRREARTKALGGKLMEIPRADLNVVDLKAPQGYVSSLALIGSEPVVRYCGSGAE
jgi:4'-phosphopantetheinyl transferase